MLHLFIIWHVSISIYMYLMMCSATILYDVHCHYMSCNVHCHYMYMVYSTSHAQSNSTSISTCQQSKEHYMNNLCLHSKLHTCLNVYQSSNACKHIKQVRQKSHANHACLLSQTFFYQFWVSTIWHDFLSKPCIFYTRLFINHLSFRNLIKYLTDLHVTVGIFTQWHA